MKLFTRKQDETTKVLAEIVTTLEAMQKKIENPDTFPENPRLDGATEMYVLARSCRDSSYDGLGLIGHTYLTSWDYVTPKGTRTDDVRSARRFTTEREAQQHSVDLTPFKAKTTERRRDTGMWKVFKIEAKWVVAT